MLPYSLFLSESIVDVVLLYIILMFFFFIRYFSSLRSFRPTSFISDRSNLSHFLLFLQRMRFHEQLFNICYNSFHILFSITQYSQSGDLQFPVQQQVPSKLSLISHLIFLLYGEGLETVISWRPRDIQGYMGKRCI